LRAIGSQVARWEDTNAAMRSALWIVACVLLSVASWAQELQRFEIRSAYVERTEGVYQLNATLVFELPEGAREAIREGSPLTLDLDIVLHRSRRLWLDESVAALQQHYEVSFHALSERYLVRNLNSGQQSSYPNLDAALDSLRVISNLPILDQSLLLPESRHEVSLRAHLDVRTMPDALRFIVFWAQDWRQSTEWYTWSPQI
jgi:7,8-dihydro-6-hydroxymethylpterin-pyrophosphokinase